MTRFASVLALAATLAAAPLASTPALADEIEDSIAAALEAYRAGDTNLAKEELDYAGQLLSQMKAEGLSAFLPDPMDGWTREDGDTQALGAAMMGGGLTANAAYARGGERVEINLMADNPMVNAMAGMFANTTMMGAMGSLKRINGQKVVLTNDGEIQALINNRILVQVSGSAAVEDKEAYFAAIDMDGLKAF
ncbi:hypothetical protein [Roseospira visakhapatnamensis]|uniref:Uncharacterized protein n=1 Tax=Roseospira visakhapatnamensis TaxID=390880 RepID=A0A7W6RF59_9PROT|nr:hypothetical protein [Roseospira visakhapatnamensis]MBB4266803.1 hypothetical protein [Roseospira visakhapatnamensis]